MSYGRHGHGEAFAIVPGLAMTYVKGLSFGLDAVGKTAKASVRVVSYEFRSEGLRRADYDAVTSGIVAFRICQGLER